MVSVCSKRFATPRPSIPSPSSVTSSTLFLHSIFLLRSRNFFFLQNLVLSKMAYKHCVADLLSPIPRSPRTVLSTHQESDIILRCLESGADDYLLKPVRLEVVKNLWQHVWKRKNGGDQHEHDQSEFPALQTLNETLNELVEQDVINEDIKTKVMNSITDDLQLTTVELDADEQQEQFEHDMQEVAQRKRSLSFDAGNMEPSALESSDTSASMTRFIKLCRPGETVFSSRMGAPLMNPPQQLLDEASFSFDAWTVDADQLFDRIVALFTNLDVLSPVDITDTALQSFITALFDGITTLCRNFLVFFPRLFFLCQSQHSHTLTLTLLSPSSIQRNFPFPPPSLPSPPLTLFPSSTPLSPSDQYYNTPRLAYHSLTNIYACLTTGGLLTKLSTHDVLSLFLAAVAMSSGHPMASEELLCESHHDLAIRFNYTNVVQNAVVSHFLDVFNASKLIATSHPQYLPIRKHITDLLTNATIQQVSIFIDSLQSILPETEETFIVPKNRNDLVQALLNFSCVTSFLVGPSDSVQQRVHAFQEQIYALGDQENELSLPISPFANREKDETRLMVSSFTSELVNPSVKTLGQFMTETAATTLKSNTEAALALFNQ
eukprot:TRINITY_DN87_c0_g1_i5.p1 TRINITY_DN87_c0_g1~~TRINITY_DN87_c0_g1_i5.p1  ORF type:complete len:605 (-),score=116.53 TRINITY_DN87_c0_g1_i5:225-2039(-)